MSLEIIAMAGSDNEATRRLNVAREALFQSINMGRRAG